MTKKLTFLLLVLITFNTYSKPKDTKDYLRVVLNNLEKVESAAYSSIHEGWLPFDTAAFYLQNLYIKEYNNPLDTTIGGSFVNLLQDDTTHLNCCYDGKMSAFVFEDEKIISIDSFKVNRNPFRMVVPPFFNYAKNIIKFALETKDSITISIEDRNEAVYCRLTIFEDKQVEFFGKAYYLDNPSVLGETASIYEFWFNKSTNLPYKIRREMAHSISVQSINLISINKLNINDFSASSYFMPDYKVALKGTFKTENKANRLIGKKAPDWMLVNTNDKMQSLTELTSKVRMIQYTSVACGPCKLAIPFMNGLSASYNPKDFDFVAIECTAKSLDVLKNYQNKNAMNYKFLKSTRPVLDEYAVDSYPTFFIIDQDQIIQKVIYGYTLDKTDTEIKGLIDRMIQ